MNYQLFLFILNLILLSRLKLTFKDDGAQTADIIKMAIVPLVGLIFLQINFGWFLLLVYLLIYPLLMYGMEQKRENLNRNRTLVLWIHIIVIAMISGLLQINLIPSWLQQLAERFLLDGSQISPAVVLDVQILIFGLLMVINEMNITLRYLFKILGLEPLGSENKDVDEQEYNTGRVIGMLERIFVFIFVLSSQYAAVGFILAAKGVARFQDFKNRTFAEYVLIGTLISTLLAMVVAFIVRAAL